jgi:hypothetical protein
MSESASTTLEIKRNPTAIVGDRPIVAKPGVGKGYRRQIRFSPTQEAGATIRWNIICDPRERVDGVGHGRSRRGRSAAQPERRSAPEISKNAGTSPLYLIANVVI